MAAGIITTGNFPKDLWPGVFAHFGITYAERPEQWRNLCHTITPSKQKYEEVVQYVGMGLAVNKAETQGIAYDSMVQGYTARATHVTYALGGSVSMEAIQDQLYEPQAKRIAAAMAFSHRQTKENVVANVFNNGFNPAFAIGDGQSVFSTAHPLTSGGAMANTPFVAAELAEASLEDALIDIAGFKDDRGLVIGVMPRKLFVSRFNLFQAKRILGSMKQSGTANNDINAVREMNALPDGYEVNYYFTANQPWFVKNDIPSNSGLVFFDRMPVKFDQDNDFNSKNALFSAIARYSVLVSDPRCLYGVNAV